MEKSQPVTSRCKRITFRIQSLMDSTGYREGLGRVVVWSAPHRIDCSKGKWENE